MPAAPKPGGGGRARRRAKKEKRRARFASQYHSPGFVFYTHSQRCIVADVSALICSWHDMDAAHAASKGAGGTAEDVFPACHVHHMQQGTVGVRTFERLYGVSLAEAARAHWASWQALSRDERVEWERRAVEVGYKWP
jgi:hypothetical protein